MSHLCPPDHKHGQNLGCYTAHGCRCDDCGAASRDYKYYRDHMRAAGRADVFDSRVDATGTRRRLQALCALGWSFRELGHRLGVDDALIGRWARATTVRRSTSTRVDELYEQLSGTVPPTTTQAQRFSAARARETARREGWVPPLAWDDIDTDPAPPEVVVIHVDDIDPVAIDLATAGVPTPLTPAERRIVVEQLLAAGHTDTNLIARMADCTPRQVQRIRHALAAPAGLDEEADAA